MKTKTKLKFTLVVLAGALVSVNVQAQNRNDVRDAAGFGMYSQYTEIKGSPFLFKSWAAGNVKTLDKAEKKDVQIKYDEVDDRLLLRGKDDDDLLTFSSPVVEFTIADPEKSGAIRTFKAGFAPTKFSTEKTIFEVLTDGKVKLLRKNGKIISEGKEYGSAAIIKTVVDGLKYYVVTENNEPVIVKLDQKAILALLPTKQAELTEYIKSNKLNVKKQEDAAKLIAYYNTL